MNTTIKLTCMMMVVACAACGTTPAKKNVDNLTQKMAPKASTLSDAFYKHMHQDHVLRAMTLGKGHLGKWTHVAAQQPCQIKKRAASAPSTTGAWQVFDLTYDDQKRLIRSEKKYANGDAIVYRLTYEKGKLVKSTLDMVRASGTNLAQPIGSTFQYDKEGKLVGSSFFQNGKELFKFAYTYDDAKRTVNIKRTAVVTGQTKDQMATFDAQWRPLVWLNTTHTYLPNKVITTDLINQYGSKIETTLQNGRAQGGLTYMSVRAPSQPAGTWMKAARRQMTYKGDKLVAIRTDNTPTKQRFGPSATEYKIEYECATK